MLKMMDRLAGLILAIGGGVVLIHGVKNSDMHVCGLALAVMGIGEIIIQISELDRNQ